MRRPSKSTFLNSRYLFGIAQIFAEMILNLYVVNIARRYYSMAKNPEKHALNASVVFGEMKIRQYMTIQENRNIRNNQEPGDPSGSSLYLLRVSEKIGDSQERRRPSRGDLCPDSLQPAPFGFDWLVLGVSGRTRSLFWLNGLKVAIHT